MFYYCCFVDHNYPNNYNNNKEEKCHQINNRNHIHSNECRKDRINNKSMDNRNDNRSFNNKDNNRNFNNRNNNRNQYNAKRCSFSRKSIFYSNNDTYIRNPPLPSHKKVSKVFVKFIIRTVNSKF